jgi:hypothetical protein
MSSQKKKFVFHLPFNGYLIAIIFFQNMVLEPAKFSQKLIWSSQAMASTKGRRNSEY